MGQQSGKLSRVAETLDGHSLPLQVDAQDFARLPQGIHAPAGCGIPSSFGPSQGDGLARDDPGVVFSR